MNEDAQVREAVVKLLWEKQFENSPWADKFHLIRRDSLGEYGEIADKIIAAVPHKPVGWKCFHCGEEFADNMHGQRLAAEHFGTDQLATPGCVMRLQAGEGGLLRRVRVLEEELRRYRSEDSDKDRELHAITAKQARALLGEEEKGYGKGLRDGQALMAAALETAAGHIEHMAAWIGKQNAGYSFEGLGEDMPGIRDAIASAKRGE